MHAVDLPVTDGESAGRVVRALGTHRYVRGRLHLVHTLAIEAAWTAAAATGGDTAAALADAAAWARAVTAPASGIDVGSRDERLVRRCSDAELAAVLEACWGAAGELARARLAVALGALGLPSDEDREPFEVPDDDLTIFPLLVDAGWELLPLAELDPERHKGALGAFEPTALAAARASERASAAAYLHELPALGAAELLRGQAALPPLVLWVEGPEPYMDYVVRGVSKVARLGGGAERDGSAP